MTNHTSMNQQELLTDLLTQEKDLVKDYASGITESSCTNLRELLMSNLAECSADQFAVFDEMHNVRCTTPNRLRDPTFRRLAARCSSSNSRPAFNQSLHT